METPDWYKLADWDGRAFWEFYRDECAPIVAERLNDGQKHALQSACEHLFRRGFKGDERDDLQKYRWWLKNCLHEHLNDDTAEPVGEAVDRIEMAIAPVLALVEWRRSQKAGAWYALWPKLSDAAMEAVKQEIHTVWGPVESLDDVS